MFLTSKMDTSRCCTAFLFSALDYYTLSSHLVFSLPGLLLLALSVAMLHAHYALVATKIGMMARIMTTSAVYHKVGAQADQISVCLIVLSLFII